MQDKEIISDMLNKQLQEKTNEVKIQQHDQLQQQLLQKQKRDRTIIIIVIVFVIIISIFTLYYFGYKKIIQIKEQYQTNKNYENIINENDKLRGEIEQLKHDYNEKIFQYQQQLQQKQVEANQFEPNQGVSDAQYEKMQQGVIKAKQEQLDVLMESMKLPEKEQPKEMNVSKKCNNAEDLLCD